MRGFPCVHPARGYAAHALETIDCSTLPPPPPPIPRLTGGGGVYSDVSVAWGICFRRFVGCSADHRAACSGGSCHFLAKLHHFAADNRAAPLSRG